MARIDHIGYAVRNLDEKKKLMENLLGFEFAERKVYERTESTSRLDFYQADGGVIEVVETSNPTSGLNQFIEERGEGLHHICFEVEDIRATMSEWEAKGVTFTTVPPRYGSRGGLLTFTDPATTGGLSVELVQYLKEGEEIPDCASK